MTWLKVTGMLIGLGIVVVVLFIRVHDDPSMPRQHPVMFWMAVSDACGALLLVMIEYSNFLPHNQMFRHISMITVL